MTKLVKIRVLLLLVVVTGLYWGRTLVSIPREEPRPKAVGQTNDALGWCIQELERGHFGVVVPEVAYTVWPDVAQLLQLYSSHGQDRSGKGLKDVTLSEEAQLIYEYLFAQNPEQTQLTLKMLGRSLCLSHMDTVWPLLRRAPLQTPMPANGRCPVTGEPYWVKPETSICFVHQGLNKAWPSLAAIPFLGSCHRRSPVALRCSYHYMDMSFPWRSVMEPQPELYSQLSMGYFNQNRVHLLDKVLVDDPISAAKPGETVVDVGCGAGCYIWSMARAVGSSGTVLAQDVDGSVLDFVSFVARKRGCSAVRTVMANREDPKLAAKSVDRIFIIDVYNVIVGSELDVKKAISSESTSYMARLISALRPGGKLVIVDFTPEKNRPHVPIKKAIEHMQGLGLKLVQQDYVAVGPRSKMYALVFNK